VASMASASPRADATQGLLFYLASYAATVIGAFGVVAIIERRLALSGAGDDLSSWSGLSDRHPGLAAAMSLFMVSLAGVPPTAGFMAKLTVFRAAIEAGLAPLAIFGVLTKGSTTTCASSCTCTCIRARRASPSRAAASSPPVSPSPAAP